MNTHENLDDSLMKYRYQAPLNFFWFTSCSLPTPTFYFSILLSLALNAIESEGLAIHSYLMSYGLIGIDFLYISQPKYPPFLHLSLPTEQVKTE